MSIISLHSINQAVLHLRAGDLVIYPTETAYALGADATNATAVRNIYKIKRRPANKPLPLIVASLVMAKRYCDLPELLSSLAQKYWPGPLTIVASIKKNLLPRGIVSKNKTVAVRVSSHPKARLLSKLLGRPIVSTSANISGRGNSYGPRSVAKFFSSSPINIYFLSGDTLPRHRPSTIITLKRGKLIVLRRGALNPKP